MEKKIMTLNIYSSQLQSNSIPNNRKISIDANMNPSIAKTSSVDNDVIQTFETSEKLPNFMPFEYKNSDNYFTVPFSGTEQKLHAIMTANDPIWIVLSKKTQNSILYNFKISISTEFNKLYKYQIYRHYFVKSGDEQLTNNDNQKNGRDILYNAFSKDDVEISSPYLHMISDFLDVNIIQMYDYGYEWVSLFIRERATLILWTHDGKSGCLLHKNKKNHLSPINENSSLFLNSADIYGERTEKINIESDPIKKKYLTLLKKQKKCEIEKIALSKSLNIFKEKSNSSENPPSSQVLLSKDEIIRIVMLNY
jgi:hypothetical protein